MVQVGGIIMKENYRPYLETVQSVLAETASAENGLSGAQAAERTEQYGPNRLVEAKKRSAILRFFDQMKDPMIIILLVAAALSLVTSLYEGENPADVFIILFVVVLNSVLGVVQESKAEEAIEALKKMTAAKSKVLRDGEITTLPSDELVPGDVIILEAGDSIPADGRLLEAASMKVEEAALTGESVPVTKQSEEIVLAEGAKDIPLGDRKNMIYMGSTVVYGRGKAVITGTGMSTEMGKIADALAQAEEEMTPLLQDPDQTGHRNMHIHLRFWCYQGGTHQHGCHDRHLHARYITRCCCYSGRSRSGSNNSAFHGRYQDVQQECCHKKTYCS